MPNEYDLDFKQNPEFNTVLELSNRTFDPDNIVSGRGATEDQLKFVYDKHKEISIFLEEQGCSDDPYTLIIQKVEALEAQQAICCDNPQDHIIQAYNTRLDELEARQIACCNNEGSTVTAVFNQIQNRIAQLEERIAECCGRTFVGNDVPYNDTQECVNSTSSVSVTWPNTSGGTGQVNFVPSIGTTQTATLYYFVSEMTNGIYMIKSTEIAVGKGKMSLNPLTGVVTHIPNVYDTIRGRRFVVVGVTTSLGCERLQVSQIPWDRFSL